MYNIVGPLSDGVELSPSGIRTANIAADTVKTKLLHVQQEVVLAQPDLEKLKKSLLGAAAAPVTPGAMKAFSSDKVDNEILPRLEVCVSDF